jgi:ethanolamine ammonia-lyase small subunit
MMAGPPANWQGLRRFTNARVALGRVGNAMPTAAHLAFQAAHAELDTEALAAALAARGVESRVVRSACPDRQTYLLRPDLGRTLDPASAQALRAKPATGRLAIVVCDGLSARAAQTHAAPLLARLMMLLERVGPVVLARQARVALGDEIGAALGAEAVLVLIGERPGLSSPDSLGAYLTWAPRPGRHDAERNCVSNIRPDGLAIDAAAAKLAWLVQAMRRVRLTGVGLKDEQPVLEATAAPPARLA